MKRLALLSLLLAAAFSKPVSEEEWRPLLGDWVAVQDLVFEDSAPHMPLDTQEQGTSFDIPVVMEQNPPEKKAEPAAEEKLQTEMEEVELEEKVEEDQEQVEVGVTTEAELLTEQETLEEPEVMEEEDVAEPETEMEEDIQQEVEAEDMLADIQTEQNVDWEQVGEEFPEGEVMAEPYPDPEEEEPGDMVDLEALQQYLQLGEDRQRDEQEGQTPGQELLQDPAEEREAQQEAERLMGKPEEPMEELEEEPILEAEQLIGTQPCSGVVMDGRCYRFFSAPKRAADAEFFCQRTFTGGHLASIGSSHVHRELMNLIRGQHGHVPRTWVGGLRFLNTGRFVWLDGTAWSYADWLRGEPNNTSGVEDCVEMLPSGKFNDFTCWEPQAFVCSYPSV